MTPKISFITATVGAALVLAVPAWGDSWGADQGNQTVRVSPDLVDLLTAKNGVVDAKPHGRGRPLMESADYVATASSRRGIDKAVHAWLAPESNVSTYAACAGRGACAPREAFERAARPAGAAYVATVSSGSGIEWPQIGVGFVVGILLALGLVLGLRYTQLRSLAH